MSVGGRERRTDREGDGIFTDKGEKSPGREKGRRRGRRRRGGSGEKQSSNEETREDPLRGKYCEGEAEGRGEGEGNGRGEF